MTLSGDEESSSYRLCRSTIRQLISSWSGGDTCKGQAQLGRFQDTFHSYSCRRCHGKMFDVTQIFP